MSKHTPGPWESSGQLILTKQCHPHPNPKSQHEPKIVGEVHWSWDGDRGGKEQRIDWPEAAANQQLMIAAPDLLEALRECFSDPNCFAFASDDFYKAKQRLLAINNIVRRAVQEATGETIK